MTGAYTGIPHASSSPHTGSQKFVVYEYDVKGLKYEGNRIGMGYRHWSLAPFWKMRWEQGQKLPRTVPVYFLPSTPNIAVLHRGIDVMITVSLAFIGFVFVCFSKWIDSLADDAK